jgi:hypothetical protein
MRSTGLYRAAAALILLTAVPCLGAAEPITISLVARVDSVYDPGDALHEAVQPGQLLLGTFTFDPAAPDTNPDPNVGRYEHHQPPYGITIEAGTHLFQSDQRHVEFSIEVANDEGVPPRDSYVVTSTSNLPFETGALVSRISWQLVDASRRALVSASLEDGAPDLSKWKSEFGLTIEGRQAVDFLIRAQVTQVMRTDVRR